MNDKSEMGALSVVISRDRVESKLDLTAGGEDQAGAI